MITSADNEQRQRATRILHLLSSRARAHILELLAAQDGTLHVEKLATELQLAQPTVSHHLKVLTRAGLLKCEKGNYQYHHYHVDRQRLAEMRKVVDAWFEQFKEKHANG
jgi:ArsR family transcriptional regulator, arsenate/arsenite/antimonite-responsive transcriptional repressor